MTALLEVEQLDTAYGSSQVLFGMQLAIGQGEVASLLGRNGMGKTTTVRSCRPWARPATPASPTCSSPS